MAKYSTEFKMKLVKEYLEGKIGYRELAKKYNIPNKRAIQTWVSAYKTQGYDGLKVSRRNNNYSLEFKLNVVNLYLTGEMSYQSLANNLKINNPSIITQWVNEYRKKGIEGLKPKKRGRPSKMAKIPDKSKDINIELSAQLTTEEDNSLNEAQLKKNKEVRRKQLLASTRKWCNKKKIELSHMTDAEIRQLLEQSRS